VPQCLENVPTKGTRDMSDQKEVSKSPDSAVTAATADPTAKDEPPPPAAGGTKRIIPHPYNPEQFSAILGS